jgi:hypothetical protein
MFQAHFSADFDDLMIFMKMRLAAVSLMIWAFALAALASDLKCDVCGTNFHGKYFYAEDLAVGGRKIICPACAEITDKCFACGLPVKEGYQSLPDGRLLCARDSKDAIQTEEAAKEIAAEVPEDLDRLLSRYMTFPGTNALVSIVNRFYLENLFKMPGEGQACVSVYGATTSNRLPGHGVVHSIALLSHLRKSRLMAVCAHEYTHAWMGENVTRERNSALDKDTTEAFCELVAYKYMESRQESFEMEAIKRNTYTKGKIDVLLAADSKYGFEAVIDWLKSGDDATLDLGNLERIRAVGGNYVPPAPVAVAAIIPAAVAPIKSPAPSTLELKSISGTDQHRFAMINNATFETMEHGKVRVGQTNVSVRCLEIRNDSVMIQIDGSNEKKQLFLRPQ